ncbi:MAG TPA: intradiol ring-cleavage dioxygenase [Ideonella sp.]|nr:intradiol ring-cleavage dioxygenase [Ideonella sp.]
MPARPVATPPPQRLLSSRRTALGALGALSATPLLGLPDAALAADAWDEDFSASQIATARSCALIPQETEGPYPLSSVLDDPSKVRRDITEGRTGVAMGLALKLVDVNNGCAPIANAAVYIWHCDKDGVYSGYSQPGNDTRGETFLRGVQVSNAKGIVRFTSIYPGWYSGRITHVHFQVYLNDNTGAAATATSQIAFPQDVTQAVYASPLYAAHGQNTSVRSFAADNVFSDGTTYQMATLKGSVAKGYAAKLLVGVSA